MFKGEYKLIVMRYENALLLKKERLHLNKLSIINFRRWLNERRYKFTLKYNFVLSILDLHVRSKYSSLMCIYKIFMEKK